MGLFRKKEKFSMNFMVISVPNLDKGVFTSLNKLEEGISFGKQKSFINYNDIINIEYKTYTEEEIKKKSIIGRAIVGGVIAGGVGAVVGGLTGVKDKKTTKNIYVVDIKYINNGSVDNILLEDYTIFGTDKFIDSIKSRISPSN